MTSVMPVAWICRTSSMAVRISVGVRPAMASSSSSTLGSEASALAISSRLRPGVPRLLAGASASGAEADVVDHLARLVAGGGGAGIAQEGADHHVVEHRHGLERQRHLEGAGDAEARALLRRQRGDVAALEMHGAARSDRDRPSGN